MENMITKLYHDQSVLVPFFLFLTEVCCKKVENGTVENGLGPKGHKEDNLRLQVYLKSKKTVVKPRLLNIIFRVVVERKHYHPVENGAVKHGLGPEGHIEDNLGLQVYWTSK